MKIPVIHELNLIKQKLDKVNDSLHGGRPEQDSLSDQNPHGITPIPSQDLLQPGKLFYNSSIIDFEGGYLMVYRREQILSLLSDICICRLRKDFSVVEGSNKLLFPLHRDHTKPHDPREPSLQCEDPRAFRFRNEIYVSYLSFTPRTEVPTIRLAKLNTETWTLETGVTPRFGYNGRKPEKNWVFFENQGELLFVYSHDPLVIAQCDPATGACQRRSCHLWQHSYLMGLMRGGSPPIFKDGAFYSFFHSSLSQRYHWRRYAMGVLAFSASPPYAPLAVTNEPLLVASEKEPFISIAPLVVFPAGAVIDGQNRWHVSMGVNDIFTAIGSWPHADLLSRMDPVHAALAI
jgi:predicted GH43/DUF377 family glycosyl hydrolase